MKDPKLRTVNKVKPPYLLNQFPDNFVYILGQEIIYILATKNRPVLEGEEWEQIFSKCIGAQWSPSNVGLDDVVLDCCAWGAKTVKVKRPSRASKVRLISGRNSPTYSFGQSEVVTVDATKIGRMIMKIWNERVYSVRRTHKHLRTVVLMKSDDLSEVGIFEFDTNAYDYRKYNWCWNKNDNLEGHCKSTREKIFTWQPHGAQFTITEKVPNNCLIVNLKKPESVDRDILMKSIGFDKSWITYYKKGKP